MCPHGLQPSVFAVLLLGILSIADGDSDELCRIRGTANLQTKIITTFGTATSTSDLLSAIGLGIRSYVAASYLVLLHRWAVGRALGVMEWWGMESPAGWGFSCCQFVETRYWKGRS